MRFILFLVALSTFAQNNPNTSIIRKIITNGVTSGATYSVPNIGQVQHQVIAEVTINPGVCLLPSYVQLQGSADNTNWFNIAPIITLDPTNSATANGNIYGTGLFPYLRLKVIGASSACVMNAWYVGTVTAFSNPQSVMNSANYTISSNTVAASGGGTTSVQITPPVTSSGLQPVIYGLMVYQSDTANVYEYVIQSADALGCTGATGPKISFKVGSAGGPNYVLPTSTVPYLIGGVGKGVCVTGTSAAGSTAATFTFISRYEGGS